MDNILILDISDIQIIAHKTEDTDFRFFNPQRPYDGLIMITSGNGYAIDGNGKKYAVTVGDIIIANKDDRYSIELDAPCSYVTSGFSLNTDKSLLPFIYKSTETQSKRLKDVCKIWQSRSRYSYAFCRIGLLQLYMDIVQSTSILETENSFIDKAISYIHKNFKTNFSGADIAAYCSVSLSHLRSQFLRQTGKTVLEYRNSLRISAAKEMLESKYYSVAEIAAELGYCDVYHFSKSFSSSVGCAPSRWKKEQ